MGCLIGALGSGGLGCGASLPIVTSVSLGRVTGRLIGTKGAPEKGGGLSCRHASTPVASEAISRGGSSIAHEIDLVRG